MEKNPYFNNMQRALGIGLKSVPEIDIEYPLAAANAFTTHLVPNLRKNGKKFRFVLTSGLLSSRDQNASLWYLRDVRKAKVPILSPFSHSSFKKIPGSLSHARARPRLDSSSSQSSTQRGSRDWWRGPGTYWRESGLLPECCREVSVWMN